MNALEEMASKVKMINKKISDLDIKFSSKIDTMREFINEESDQKIKEKLITKLKDTQINYEINRQTLQKMKSKYQSEFLQMKQKYEHDMTEMRSRGKRKISKLSVIMEILKQLEGTARKPVPESVFMDHIVMTGEFDLGSARQYIIRLLREATIYESKPAHFNTV